jgi:GT2 family glycosyltransferase
VETTIVETGPEWDDLDATFMPGAGYAGALDWAFRGAETYLIALNADTRFPAESIRPLLDLFRENPRLAVLGPRQVNPAGRIVHAGILEAGDTHGGRGFGEADAGQYRERLLLVPQVSGSVMIIRRDVYAIVGGFSRMPTLYFEDAIFCKRVRRAGWTVAYSGLLTFQHRVAASPQPEGTSRAALAAEGRDAWLRELG